VASAQVRIGNFNGPFTVTFRCGDATATFNLRATSQPARLVRVSGDQQRVSAGGTTADQLVVRVEDNSGNPTAAVAVTFRAPTGVTLLPAQGNGANPLVVNTGADGQAAVRVRVPANAAVGNIEITATGTNLGNVTFSVAVIGRAPSFTAASIVNAASFAPGLVPGGLATLFGTGLSEITGTELPGGATSHRGVSVSIDGVPVPLFAVSNVSGQEQINFQVRTDLGVPSTVRVEVNNNGAITSVSNVQVLRAQPGIYEYTPQGSSTKYAVATRFSDGQVVGPNTAVSRGDHLTIYVNATGVTLPQLPTGQAAPANPPARTFFQPTVGIGGRGMQVTFSGLTPGLIGLGQINILVGQDAPTGASVPLDVVVEGVASQTSRIAVQ
jgi:uncharacterized protein (TIGR03437 family)